jgi:thioredoxin-like negative regulator of GroEL
VTFPVAWLLCSLAVAAGPGAPLPEALPEGAPRPDPTPATREPVIRRVQVDVRSLKTELVSASRIAAREKARILVLFGASWCEPCRALEAAFVREQNRAAFAGWRLVEVDVDTLPPGPVLGLELSSVPALVKLDPSGRPAGVLQGGRLPAMDDAAQVDAALHRFLRP